MEINAMLKNIEEATRGKVEFVDLSDYMISPYHYSGEIETIDYIEDKLTREQFEGYLLGNALKYLSRYNKKNKPIDDIKKAVTYLYWMIDHEKDM